ncbi:MAG TPA: ABC transporter permease [Candidatus Acidoferrales bacterium]|nr:ABC transporter permease [Candidatus Acidoferrales bacterium]
MFRRKRKLGDFRSEIESHLALEIERLQQEQDLSYDEARATAYRAFGNVTKAQERFYESGRWLWIDHLWQDVRFAVRVLRKSPGFTAVAILTLALGIGANTAIFSVINGVLLKPLPYAQPDQLVAAVNHESLPDIIDIRRMSHAFSQGGGINIFQMDYQAKLEPVKVRVGLVDAGFLETLGVAPMLGRIIEPQEDVKGAAQLAVVTYSFWQNYLGSDSHAVGRTILLNSNSYVVIGVMPREFVPPNEKADLFVSYWAGDPRGAPDRDVHSMHAYWRLKPGVTVAQAEAEMAPIDRQLSQQYPSEEKGRRTILVALHQWLVRDVRTALLVLLAAVGLVLLIACTNFAGLLMARSVTRRQEFVVRGALGAEPTRLIQQAVTESALLSLIGGAAGLVLAEWGTDALLSLKPAELDRFNGIHMDGHVLLFVFGISIFTGIVFGFLPAWSASHAPIGEVLKENSRTTTAGRAGDRMRQILVVSELALALILLIGAGLLIKGFLRLRSVNPGFNPKNVTTMIVRLPTTRYGNIPKQTEFRRALLERLKALPGAEVGMVSDIPLGDNYVGHSIVIDGRPAVAPGDAPRVQTLAVMGDYFGVMQIPIVAGRDFTGMDREEQPLVAIVNEEMVHRFFSHQNPIGARIDWANDSGPHRWMTIVGVAADVKQAGLDQPVDPAVYTPFSQSDERWRSWMTLTIRGNAPSASLVAEAKKIVASLDSQIAVSDVYTMDELLSVSVAQQRFDMLLLGLFAALALILALVGTYGVMAYVVGQRTHEIGLRVALGAQRTDVLRLVVGQGGRLALTGIAIGVAGALGLTRLMSSLLFEVTPTDPATFTSVAILLGTVALLACYIPARRAMRVDPMTALRHE